MRVLLKGLDRLEEILIASLIGGATLLIFVAVVDRYALDLSAKWHWDAVYDTLFKINLSWAQELCIYMFVWMAKFGAAYGVRTGIHVGVDVLVNKLPPKARLALDPVRPAGRRVLHRRVGTMGAKFVWDMAHTDQTSPDLEWPMWIIYLAIPLGSYLMCFRFLQVAWSFFCTGELPHHDASHVEGVDPDRRRLPSRRSPRERRDERKRSASLRPDDPDARDDDRSRSSRSSLLSIAALGNAGIIFALLVALMLTGMPISIALGLTVLTFLFTMTTVPIESVGLKLFTGIEKFEIMAVPFFILAGNFLTHGGVARRMIDFATSMVGHFHGGLALAGIVACAMFALVCGSSVATVVAIGSIVLPEMVRAGYPMRFGAGVITVAGSLGILMLPSIPKVIYAVATNTSIGALFVAGLFPGILLTTMLCTVTWWIAKKRGYPKLQAAQLAASAGARSARASGA